MKLLDKLTTKQKDILIEFLRAIVAAFVAAITALLSTSCGAYIHATARNPATQSTVTISVSTSNPVNVETSPSINFDSVSVNGSGRLKRASVSAEPLK